MNKFKKIILNNGVPLYLCVDPTMKRVFVSYNIKYGSSGKWFNFNNNGKDYSVGSGYAHYLEHLLGEHSRYGDMYRNFDKRYQRANAYTAMDVTSYHFNGKDEIEKSLEELITAIDTPVFDKEDVDKTRHAIEEESTSRNDDHIRVLECLIKRNLYGGFDIYDETLSPIGNKETTRQINTETLYDCYNAFYTDNNKFIVIGGNVDEQKIVDLLNNIYAKLQPQKTNLILPTLDYDSIRCKNEVLDRDIDNPLVGLGMKFKKPDNVSLKELYFILYIIRNSLLESDELRAIERKSVYDYCSKFNMPVMDNGIDYSIVFASKNKNELISNILELLSKRIITEKDYELTKKGIIAGELRSIENKYRHLSNSASSIIYNEDYCDCDFYQSIDYNRFMEIASKLDFSNYTVGEVKRLIK